MEQKFEELKLELSKLDSLVRELNSLYSGKNAKIISTTYNGQQYGSSKPKLTGKVYPIRNFFISTGRESTIGVFLSGLLLSLKLDDIEFVD